MNNNYINSKKNEIGKLLEFLKNKIESTELEKLKNNLTLFIVEKIANTIDILDKNVLHYTECFKSIFDYFFKILNSFKDIIRVSFTYKTIDKIFQKLNNILVLSISDKKIINNIKITIKNYFILFLNNFFNIKGKIIKNKYLFNNKYYKQSLVLRKYNIFHITCDILSKSLKFLNFIQLDYNDKIFISIEEFKKKFYIKNNNSNIIKETFCINSKNMQNNDLLLLQPHNTTFSLIYCLDLIKKKNKSPSSCFEYRYFNINSVFRRDKNDRSHKDNFHQLDGIILLKNRDINIKFLKNILNRFIRLFWKGEIRFRKHFFPYTQPSLEVDLYCGCKKLSCKLCKIGWIEIMGCGIIRRNILIDNKLEEFNGYAFGLGVERIAMFLFNLDNIRDIY